MEVALTGVNRVALAGLAALLIVGVAILAVPTPRNTYSNLFLLHLWREKVWFRGQTRARALRMYVWVVAALALGVVTWLVVWVLPVILTSEPAINDPAARHKAAADVRTNLVALLLVFGAIGTLIYTGRSYRLNREGQVTDRYTKAIEQLAEPRRRTIRLGGIYALHRIALDSKRDHRTILSVLTAFIQEESVKMIASGGDGRPVQSDVEAAASVISQLPVRVGIMRANFSKCHLNRMVFVECNLNGAQFGEAYLRNALFYRVELTLASFNRAHLEGAVFQECNLDSASFADAHLMNSEISEGSVRAASLWGASVDGAKLWSGFTSEQLKAAGSGDSHTVVPAGLPNPWAEDKPSV
jgi:hypothetical protein